MKHAFTILINLFLLAGLISGCGSKKKETPQDMMDAASELYYQEPYRPQFHFSPDSMWMNDPNGMVYYDGEYHLFYQYYPDSTVWGPMHWGHAVSTDLVHWQHLPIALYPDSLGDIFSGSAVIDWNNTTGFGKDNIPPMVAIFTYHDPVGAEKGRKNFQTQGIAYSLDKGRTWTKYAHNPVLKNPGIIDFRDPKVIWYEPDNKWIMALAVKDHISLYSSKDMKSWQHESDFRSDIASYGGVWECPDLFPLKSDNNKEKWVLIVNINPGAPNGGSGTQYFVGEFDGHTFTNENKELFWIDYGKDDYAGVTWSDIPRSDGRRIFMGWMSNWQYGQVVPTEKWRSAMTFPRTLTLKKENGNYRILSNPVREIKNIQEKLEIVSDLKPNKKGNYSGYLPFRSSPQELKITVKSKTENLSDFALTLSNDFKQQLIFGYNAKQQQFYINRDKSGDVSFSNEFTGNHIAPFSINNSEIKLHILLDISSIEVFINGGELVMTEIVFPSQPYDLYKISGSDIKVTQFEAIRLKSIW
ncbi:glycoside hydrolase family 32 protein [Saccharicrinis sp. FJH2]|uniref:glycoside hydrolase family 32 protein n=1 Tax=Saccharicrinis sp. FJH65 TaxID=3344659 RepID=UPI0035F3F695